MLKILHVMGCSDVGGISAVVRNYYQFMDRTKVHFDIALTIPQQGQNSRALEAMGARIFFIPMKSQNSKGYRQGLTRLLKEGHYDGVHIHEGETSFVGLEIARKLGIPCRVAHAHTTSPYEGIPSVLRRWAGCIFNYYYASHVIGCGQKAGERIFGKHNMKREKAAVLPNAVDAEKFSYDEGIRREMRQQLGVEHNFVLGMVARLCDQKNIPYAVDLMTKVRIEMPEARLLIVGNGENEGMIREMIQRLGLEDCVTLLGKRPDVEKLYNAFDLLLMPSLFEGYPVAGVEALATGLPVLLSDKITGELNSFSGVQYLPLRKPESWLKAIAGWKDDEGRETRQYEISEHGLDIRTCADQLLKIYQQDAGKQ